VQDLILPGSKKETLHAVMLPDAPNEVVKFFSWLKTHIQLASTGMGVSLRESKSDLVRLLKQEDYDYPVYQNFIEEFENKLLNQHHENTKTDT
jgi:hypothetical protein